MPLEVSGNESSVGTVRKMILVIDNYDSFTYNLVQYVSELCPVARDIHVARNDKFSLNNIRELHPTHIIVSPGPGTPTEAGITLGVVKELAGTVPILGVCLGHQAIGQAWGGRVIRAKVPVHGKVSAIYHNEASILAGTDNPFPATRYHSLIVERESLPSCLKVIAWTEDEEIMGLVHCDFPSLIGLQFHPESIMTICGKQILRNFVGNIAA